MATVREIDNRGEDKVPFGYVYFTDGNRLGFGDMRDGKTRFGLFESNWGPVGDAYYISAYRALRKVLPHISSRDDLAELGIDGTEK
jgi:hypothetical protein